MVPSNPRWVWWGKVRGSTLNRTPEDPPTPPSHPGSFFQSSALHQGHQWRGWVVTVDEVRLLDMINKVNVFLMADGGVSCRER